MRAAVRVEEHREKRAIVIVREQQRRYQPGDVAPEELDIGRDERCLGDRLERASRAG